MNKTENITPASGNPQRPQEPPQAGNKKNTDKPFCFVLQDIITEAAKRAYPNLR